MVRVRFVRTRLLALKLPWPLSCSDLGGSAAKVCAAHRSNNADDACDEGSEEPSAGETENAEAALEADPEVVVSRKTAAEVGWYHPHLLAFILLRTRERRKVLLPLPRLHGGRKRRRRKRRTESAL